MPAPGKFSRVGILIIESMKLFHDKEPARLWFESIECTQNPLDGTFVNNWIKHEVGLIDASQTILGTEPSTLMTVEKETRANSNHGILSNASRICKHLIRLFSIEGQIVLNPFAGDGTSCVAAYKSRRHGIGIDVHVEHIGMTKQRVKEMISVPEGKRRAIER